MHSMVAQEYSHFLLCTTIHHLHSHRTQLIRCVLITFNFIVEEVKVSFHFFLGGSSSEALFSIYTPRPLGKKFLTNTKDT
jgi:hypothetical protein